MIISLSLIINKCGECCFPCDAIVSLYVVNPVLYLMLSTLSITLCGEPNFYLFLLLLNSALCGESCFLSHVVYIEYDFMFFFFPKWSMLYLSVEHPTQTILQNSNEKKNVVTQFLSVVIIGFTSV